MNQVFLKGCYIFIPKSKDIASHIKKNKISPVRQEPNNFCTLYRLPVLRKIIDMCKELAIPIQNMLAQKMLSDMKELKKRKNKFILPKCGLTLLEFQKEAVYYSATKTSFFLADDMGLGKTIEILAILKAEKLFPALVVCPKTLIYNWDKETKRMFPDITTLLFDTGKDKGHKADITFISYTLLSMKTAPYNYINNVSLKAIVSDECHYLKTIGTLRTEVFKQIAKKTKKVILASGTPMPNRPEELISQIDILKKAHLFGNRLFFEYQYCEAHDAEYGYDTSGASNLGELNKILKTFMLRRTKKGVLPELPEKRRNVIPVKINNRTEYNEAEKQLGKYLYKKINEELLKEGCNPSDARKQASIRVMISLSNEFLVKINHLRQITAKGKLAFLSEWLRNFMTTTKDKIVLFSYHKDIQKAINDMYPDAPHIWSSDSSMQRQEAIDKFQSDVGCRLINCSISNAEGYTLTAATHCMLFELHWTPAKNTQAEDRIHRIGQKNNVSIYTPLAIDTIDQQIYCSLEKKAEIIYQAIDKKDKKKQQDYTENIVLNFINKFVK